MEEGEKDRKKDSFSFLHWLQGNRIGRKKRRDHKKIIPLSLNYKEKKEIERIRISVTPLLPSPTILPSVLLSKWRLNWRAEVEGKGRERGREGGREGRREGGIFFSLFFFSLYLSLPVYHVRRCDSAASSIPHSYLLPLPLPSSPPSFPISPRRPSAPHYKKISFFWRCYWVLGAFIFYVERTWI